MRPSTRHPRAITVLATAALLTLTSACTNSSDTDGVASVAKASPSASTAAKDATADFFKCLNEAGIDASIDEKGILTFGSASAHVSNVKFEDGDSDGRAKAIELTIGGQDMSTQYNTCLASNPDYKPMSASKMDDKAVASAIEVGRKWAACAREHGIADLADPDPKDGRLLLPAGVTPETMTAVMAACPLSEPLPIGFQVVEGQQPDQAVLDAFMAGLNASMNAPAKP